MHRPRPSNSRSFKSELSMKNILKLLHEKVRNVLYKLGWTELRWIQTAVTKAFFDSDRDILAIGPTACGKTEAVYLPAFTAMIENPLPSIRLLCVSPLKSLINDQFQRLETLA